MPEIVPAHIIEWLEREKSRQPQDEERPRIEEYPNQAEWIESQKRLWEVWNEQHGS